MYSTFAPALGLAQNPVVNRKLRENRIACDMYRAYGAERLKPSFQNPALRFGILRYVQT